MADEDNYVGGKDMATLHTPLLQPRPPVTYHEGCPGCILDRKKAASQGPPLKELSLLALLYLSNMLPLCSLFSFVYFMVRDFGIAESETEIGSYSGYLGSALLLGRFVISTPWGMIADRYGHKPVIFFGTTTIFVFNTLFGFSTNFWMALISRTLLGLGNGMTGTLPAYASAICKEEHQAVGMSIMGTMWGLGLILGPAIGGYLAQPSEKLPALFPSGSLFDQFPYALPCVCISAFAVAGFIATFFLPESVHKHEINAVKSSEVNNDAIEDEHRKLEDHTVEVSNIDVQVLKKPVWRNWGLIASIVLISSWVLHCTAYSEVFPLWAVSPELYGGLKFTSSEVADVLAVSGAAILLFQLFVFPRIEDALGAIQTVRVSAVLATTLVVLYPLFHRLQGAVLWAVLLAVSVAKNISSVSGFTGMYILTNNSVEKKQKGVANGLSSSFMSALQACAPAFAGIMMSCSVEVVCSARSLLCNGAMDLRDNAKIDGYIFFPNKSLIVVILALLQLVEKVLGLLIPLKELYTSKVSLRCGNLFKMLDVISPSL